MAPWLTRSFGISGQFVFDHPESQTRLMALRYYPDVEVEDFDRQPGELTGDYNQRLSTSIRNQVINNPGYVIQFVMAHWLNSEISNLQIFPVRFSIQNVSELIKPEHAFWEGWVGETTPRQTAVILLNLAVLTAGGVFLVKKNSWAGILPLVINLAYHFSNAAARNSGWRYLLPVDWIFFIYFTAGIYAIINLGKKLTFEKVVPGSLEKSLPTPVPVFSLATIAIGILCIGFTPLAAEKAFPRLFPPATVSEMRQELLGYSVNFSQEDREGLEVLLANPDVIVLHGRMLYPRFYEEKEGEEKTGKTGYAPMPYARYVFLVAGEPEGTVIFPQTNSNLPLRNAQDVILVGCMDGLAVKANMVVLPEQDSATFLSEPRNSWICSKAP